MKPGDRVHLDRPGCPYHETTAEIVSIDGPLSRPWTSVTVRVEGPFGSINKVVRKFQCRLIYQPKPEGLGVA